jgi:hypothetical protein
MDNGASKNNRNMQEKTPDEKKVAENNSQATNEDLEGEVNSISVCFMLNFYIFSEFESVNNEIDSINAFLDSLETNVDNIKDQLMTIMSSNREILKELKEEQKNGENEKDDERPMET